MADGIQRYVLEARDDYTVWEVKDPHGAWVFFSDVQARLEAADARIKELEARLAAADRLAEAAEKLIRPPELQDWKGIGLDRETWDWIAMGYAPELDNALAVYRSVGKDQEGQG